MVPVELETQRLKLRFWQEEDIDDYAEICADPEVMRFLGGKTFTRLEAWRHMAFLIGHWQLRGFSHWAVEEKSSQRLIGRIGFLHPQGWPDFEIGWTLGRQSWGKGYATEAATTALDYAFNELNKEQVISLIDPNNTASIKVAERLGESRQGETELMGMQVEIYGISKDQWSCMKG